MKWRWGRERSVDREPRAASDAAAATAAKASPYMVSPLYDWVFFLLPPVVALGLGMLISGTVFSNRDFAFWGQETTGSEWLIGMFIHAHLVIVFFRSHGNPEILQRHRWRFLAVPPLLYAAMMISPWMLIAVSVLATFWDVYHSGLQTFGFARIYDRKAGNDATVGRRLDWVLNTLLYAGPIVAGATMLDHFEDFEEFDEVGATFFTSIPAFMETQQRYFTWSILALGVLFLLYYISSYWRFSQQGYKVSFLKVYLLVSTGLCSIYTWGFNTWGEAFFIMNFFHALQYFGIVWAKERKTIGQIFGVESLSWGKPLAICLFVGSALLYGFWVEAVDTSIKWLWGITLVVSIMHFWYDGFIWSVRKEQV
jgi:hypothetical protein